MRHTPCILLGKLAPFQPGQVCQNHLPLCFLLEFDHCRAVAMFVGALVASMSSTAKAVSSQAPAAAAAAPVSDQLKKLTAVSLALLLVAPPAYRALSQQPDHGSGVRVLVYTAAGFVFALGLAISGEPHSPEDVAGQPSSMCVSCSQLAHKS